MKKLEKLAEANKKNLDENFISEKTMKNPMKLEIIIL